MSEGDGGGGGEKVLNEKHAVHIVTKKAEVRTGGRFPVSVFHVMFCTAAIRGSVM